MEPLIFRLQLTTGGVREGLIQKLRGRLVEASPLPGFSRESLEDARAGRGAAYSFAKGIATYPLVDGQIEVAKLLYAESSSFHEDFERAWDSGYRTFKIKIQNLKKLEEIPQKGSLRIDSNRAWSHEEALLACKILKEHPIEFLEEPVNEDLESFIRRCPLPVAADESLVNGFTPKGASYRIVKPTILGWEQSLRFLEEGPSVLSASFESGVGIRLLCKMAVSLSQFPAGLDTYSYLRDDVLEPRLELKAITETKDLDQCEVSMDRLLLS